MPDDTHTDKPAPEDLNVPDTLRTKLALLTEIQQGNALRTWCLKPIFGSLSTEIEDMSEFLLLVGKLRGLDDHRLIRFDRELYAADAAESL